MTALKLVYISKEKKMKLYYSAGSCSTSCHITLEESGLKYETVAIDFDNASDPNIAVSEKLNGLGTLPILVTDDGKQLDQNLAIHVLRRRQSSRQKAFACCRNLRARCRFSTGSRS